MNSSDMSSDEELTQPPTSAAYTKAYTDAELLEQVKLINEKEQEDRYQEWIEKKGDLYPKRHELRCRRIRMMQYLNPENVLVDVMKMGARAYRLTIRDSDYSDPYVEKAYMNGQRWIAFDQARIVHEAKKYGVDCPGIEGDVKCFMNFIAYKSTLFKARNRGKARSLLEDFNAVEAADLSR